MPGLSGLELCERNHVRKQGYVYTILLSADNQQSDVLRGFESGADDYLCKPVNQLELRTRLKVGEIVIRSHEEVAEAHEALRFEASHDSLLRMWNRRAIIELLGKELSRAKRSQTLLSVLLADLDFFKRVNDSHGHLVGDDVLRDAAERISCAVRTCDHVGRYEGEQFLVILPSCTAEAAREVAERVRQSINDEPIGNDLQMAISIGVCQWHPGEEIRDLLHRTDAALSRAKQNGRNRVELEDVSETNQ
jgi:diguanylate cyclase (GGDEF)-like protein